MTAPGSDDTDGAARARERRIKRCFRPPGVAQPAGLLVGYAAALGALVLAAAVAGHLAITIVTAILVASLLKGLNNIVHECSHHAFSSDRRFNERVGTVLCIALLTDYPSYKQEHGSHHRHLGDYDRDLDFQLRRALAHDQPFAWRRALVQLVTLRFLWFYRLRLPTRPAHALGLAGYGVVAAGLLALDAPHGVLVLVLAHAGFLPLLRFLIDIVDHGGVYRTDAVELHRSRNFIVRNLLLRSLFFPRNDCYHLIHHLYPYLPVASFGEVHEILLEDPEYRRLPHGATAHLWRRDRSPREPRA